MLKARGQGHAELGPDDERPLRQLGDEVGWLLGSLFTVQTSRGPTAAPRRCWPAERTPCCGPVADRLDELWRVSADRRESGRRAGRRGSRIADHWAATARASRRRPPVGRPGRADRVPHRPRRLPARRAWRNWRGGRTVRRAGRPAAVPSARPARRDRLGERRPARPRRDALTAGPGPQRRPVHRPRLRTRRSPRALAGPTPSPRSAAGSSSGRKSAPNPTRRPAKPGHNRCTAVTTASAGAALRRRKKWTAKPPAPGVKAASGRA